MFINLSRYRCELITWLMDAPRLYNSVIQIKTVKQKKKLHKITENRKNEVIFKCIAI